MPATPAHESQPRALVVNGPNLNMLGTREPFRAHSYISAVATAVIAGAGTVGYELALWLLKDRRKKARA